MEPVDLDFIGRAPYRFVSSEVVHHPADRVFEAIANDPAGWGEWFPGFSRTGRYLDPGPPGVGSRREVSMARIRYQETILAWEPPRRWAFCVTKASVPFARRLAEEYQVSSHGTHSLVQWTFAIDPRAGLKQTLFLGRPVIHSLFRRAMTNLSVHLSQA